MRQRKGPSSRRPRVAVLGGGIAGLTAAHELIERGFDVDVLEARHLFGGKARSMGVPGTDREGRDALPGEHGFRFFPGFYRHLDDTLARIPFGRNRRGVLDNLVDVPQTELFCHEGPSRILLSRFPKALSDVPALVASLGFFDDIPPRELLFFFKRLLLLLTSCHGRRLEQYERLSWWDFIRAQEHSEVYRQRFAHGLTQVLVAMSPRDGSARTVGNTLAQLYAGILLPGGVTDRVLNGPTNERWIDPWVAYLKACGVRFLPGTRVGRIHCAQGRITHVSVEGASSRWDVVADHYVAALPVHVLGQHLTPALLAADPSLEGIQRLRTEWMVGIQFYLRHEVDVGSGHSMYPDSPWALTAISQGPYWERAPSSYGDGGVKTLLSVDVSDWNTPGLLTGRPARLARSKEEIRDEVWAQLKASLNRPGRTVLRDEDVVGWHLDPGIVQGEDGTFTNEEPLMVNTRGSWFSRPEATTRIANLFLAGDFVRTHTDLVTMEGANEAARRAVNGILAVAGVRTAPCKVLALAEPPVFAPLRGLDQLRFTLGQPHVWDTPQAIPDSLLEQLPLPVRELLRQAS
ncbi:hydroxysqualene dehydroxylase [Archangium lansingense]|uniref:FAD-dependent oxidoreductase n=1 Tax=Archangium lansingense TaxID=2995310 RepID=A0ABT3ZYP5_9BACT|nr:FAD-dependent oxidoreductase [Archangium lansinium]MCY1074535.1 FAD-dependent oxidoreductase [Archangium lansinium]